LGSQLERIQPGHPQQNGRHERMHLTFKQEATRPAAKNFLQQQARFDRSPTEPPRSTEPIPNRKPKSLTQDLLARSGSTG